MRSTLEALYCGDICPKETIVSSDPEHPVCNRKISEVNTMWEKKLSATEFSQFEELLALRSKSGSMHVSAYCGHLHYN